MKWLITTLCLLVPGTLVLGLTAASADEPAAYPANNVKVLLIGLTSDKSIGPLAATDLAMVTRALRGMSSFHPDTDLVALTGDDVTAANILQAVARLKIGYNETLFCYYVGHGTYDGSLPGAGGPEDLSGGHVLQIPTGDLRREALREALLSKGARLTVLITETCNVAGRFHPAGGARGETPFVSSLGVDTPLPTEEQAEKVGSAVLHDLLYNHVGVVDVNSAARDQYAWGDATSSLFTLGLVMELRTLDQDAHDNYRRTPGAKLTLADYRGPLDVFANPVEAERERMGADAADFWNKRAGFAMVGWDQFLNGTSNRVSQRFQEFKRLALRSPPSVEKGQKEARQFLADQADQRLQAFQLAVKRDGPSLVGTRWCLDGTRDVIELRANGELIWKPEGIRDHPNARNSQHRWTQEGDAIFVQVRADSPLPRRFKLTLRNCVLDGSEEVPEPVNPLTQIGPFGSGYLQTQGTPVTLVNKPVTWKRYWGN